MATDSLPRRTARWRPRYSSLVDLLRQQAARAPEHTVFTFLADGETDARPITFGELDRRARAIAVRLVERGLAGERALLMCEPGLDFIAAFFGCLYARTVAVPAYPIDPLLVHHHLPRLMSVVANSQARCALSTNDVLGWSESALSKIPHLETLIAVDESPIAQQASQWSDPGAEIDDLAFLQYTSGSTGAPKGVMLSHGNLLHQIEQLHRLDEPEARGVLWAPPYHDMGLIGGILWPIFSGGHMVLMSPVSFATRPLRWLQAISRNRAQISAAPNFAYELCVRKISPDERDTLDLSSWRVAMNGAEPVRPGTLERFAEFFALCGFSRQAFYPCYGLAEGSLMAAGGRRGTGAVVRTFFAEALESNLALPCDAHASDARALVGCGQAIADQQIAIVDPQTTLPCADGYVGEIWISGPSVAQGYWHRPDETAYTFEACLADSGRGPFMRTGDTGFVHEGELFVTGRLKDLIIVQGRNHYPHDIEATVESVHPALKRDGGAAFSIEVDGAEQLVVVHEVLRPKKVDLQSLLHRVRAAVADAHGVMAHTVVLVQTAAIPKTSSGKTQRQACRERYLRGELAVLAAWQAQSDAVSDEALTAADQSPRNGLEVLLSELFGEVLGLSRVGIHESFFRLGGHSLLATQLVSRIRSALAVELPLRALFEAPTVAELAVRVAALQGTGSSPALPLVRRGADEEPVASFAQQRLWFLDQLEPGNPFYNLPAAARLTGPLNVTALGQALDALVARHEALRTVFANHQGRPLPVVSEAACWPLAQVDLRSTPDQPAALDAALVAAAREPFDLARGPLVRGVLYQLATEEHVLLLVLHHVVADGWSMGVLVRELGLVYTAAAEQTGAGLPPLAVHYSDFAAWQRQWLAGAVYEEQLAYWQSRLGDGPAVLELPADRPRPAAPRFCGATQAIALSAELSGRLQAVSRQEGVTLFMTLLAAFQAWLSRVTGETDIAVGSPIANRTQSELEGLIGFFVNTLVMRTDVSGDPSFRELLSRVRETTLGAYAHQDLPFEKLVEVLAPQRSRSHAPLFQVALVLQNAPLDWPAGGPLTVAPQPLDMGTSKYDLTWFVWEAEGRLVGQVEYSTELFEGGTIERFWESLVNLLEGVVDDPSQTVSRLPLTSAAERARLLEQASGPSDDVLPAEGVHELIAARAAVYPERIAVEGADGTALTYEQLERQANQLAWHLQSLGVGPETLVGVALERSPRLVVTLLAIWKAGGAYVPLDPAYPRSRLELLVADSGLQVLVSQSSLLGQLPELANGQVVCLDQLGARLAAQPSTAPAQTTHPEQLAYVIYTSGSTGTPKGVQIEHRQLVNFLESFSRQPGLTACDALLAVTTISFDIAGLELFLPLYVGARVVVASREAAADGEQLASLIEGHQISVMQATPVTWRLLLATDWSPSSSFKALCGGEALDPDLAARLLALDLELWNVYGPTETTIWSTIHRLTSAELPIPIGRPIANTQCHVLDARGNLVPSGVVGELYIGGTGVARGYFNRPELNAERFVRDPFSEVPQARMYRTGDQVRWRADDTLEFVGRADQQIKLRGYRIELGEIEAALGRHFQVRECAVIVGQDATGDKRLVAYFVPTSEEAPTSRALAAYLCEHLPEYMVPAVFVRLEAMPRTPNGKIDRRALPEATTDRDDDLVITDAPRNGLEVLLSELFGEVLGLSRVGIHESFFRLGGHSLLATQLVSRIRSALAVELPLRALFEAPTVAELAVRVAALQGTGSSPALPLVRRGADEEPVASFAQQRLWFLDQLEPGNPFYNLPAAARLTGPLNVTALGQALDALVARHEALRTVFANHQGRPLPVVSEAACWPLAQVDLRSTPDQPAALDAALVAAAREPFDLARGPLVRGVLYQLATEEHVLLLVLHHVVADGWSMGVLVRELGLVYTAAAEQTGAGLPPLAVHYSDFAAWQRQWLAGAVYEEQLAYWQSRLGDGPAVLELPADRPRPAAPRFCGATQAIALSAELSGRLQAVSRQEGVTLFMTLLAAFQAWLSRVTGETDIAVGSPIANRTQSELEGLIGFFVNTLVMRTDVSGDPSFRELLSRVRETTLGAYAHQDLPFEKLVEVLAPQRSRSHAPLFQVALVLQNAPLDWPAGGPLTVAPQPLDMGTSKYDLTWFVWEAEGRLVGQVEYSTELFEGGTIERFWESLVNLLEGVVDDPSQTVSRLPLTSAAERARLLEQASGPSDDVLPAEGVHELIAARAAVYPERIAVEGADGTALTYEQLERQANQLAWHLQSLGVGPETLVGVALERSPRLVVTLLAIWKAGGAYVPLDPAYPRSRLELLVADSGLQVLVSQSSLLGQLPELANGQVVCLDQLGARLAAQPSTAPAQTTHPEQLAYVIYTSGSTGTPKGVLLGHRGLSVRLRTLARVFEIEPASRMLQFASMCFDASICELLTPLVAGAATVIASGESHLPGESLAAFLRDRSITTATLPPAVLAMTPSNDLPHLHTLISVAEACTSEIVDRWAPGRRFLNGYGPTECTIGATWAECHAGSGRPAIGRPFDGVEVYLLDSRLEPVPVGVAGELYLGGTGLARGYLNRPDLTTQRFIASPFSKRPNKRLYRTGDLARWRGDGQLEFVGRADEQVKLRGYRIELGEIEAQLRACAGVGEAVSIVREDTPGDQRLMAFIVADSAELEAKRVAEGEVEGEQVQHWQTLFDESYKRILPSADPTRNFEGWNSAITGRPLPHDDMRKWLDATVSAIRRARPRRVLEIGCGTGLVLFQLAPHCEEYVGTDFSEPSLDYVRRLVAQPQRKLDHVRLERRAADELAGLPIGHFDTVILNSVVQYFPSAEYLLRVIEGAARLVRPGGVIFLGDVRSLPLLEALHVAIELEQADGDISRDELLRRVRHRREHEQELAVEPRLFHEVPGAVPQISRVEIRLKRGDYQNELNKFRYDVMLHVGLPEPVVEPQWLDWQHGQWTVAAFRDVLASTQPAALGLRGVANARVWREAAAATVLATQPEGSVAQLRSPGNSQPPAIDPERFWELERELPYDIQITWGQTSGHYDVICRRHWTAGARVANGLQAKSATANVAVAAHNLGTQRHVAKSTNGHATEGLRANAHSNGNGHHHGNSVNGNGNANSSAGKSNGVASGNGHSQRGPSMPTADVLTAVTRQDRLSGHHVSGRRTASTLIETPLPTCSPSPAKSAAPRRPWSQYTNHPLLAIAMRRLVPSIRARLEQRLPAYMVPSSIHVLEALPLTRNGKLDRRALATTELSRPIGGSGYLAARDEIEAQLVQIWEELLQIRGIGIADDFFELGGHSLLAVRLMAQIEAKFGRKLPLAVLFQEPTIEHLAERLRSEPGAAAVSSLVEMQPRGTLPPLYCVHPAGGTVFCYRELAKHLGPNQPFFGLQAQGLAGEAAPHSRVEEMAAHYIAAMRNVQPVGPYRLAGWSLGGNLAFEMARQLREQGEEVALLALFDAGALPPDEKAAIDDFLPIIMGMFPAEENLPLETLRQLPPREQLDYFLKRAAEARLVEDVPGSAQAQHVFDVFQANLKAMLDYRPVPTDVAVTLFRAAEQTSKLADDLRLGWGDYAARGVEVHTVPGDHVHMVREPHVGDLAEQLRTCLNRALG
ncbi:MAG: amino acid adenylation domain-containing protein [Pirellulales bacterium]|nr:amino acid adenylation domain-containing protein [Pirellulales bacterium]